eukprot:scaffold4556_cov114-Isochrysis_galbana.AAC.5
MEGIPIFAEGEGPMLALTTQAFRSGWRCGAHRPTPQRRMPPPAPPHRHYSNPTCSPSTIRCPLPITPSPLLPSIARRRAATLHATVSTPRRDTACALLRLAKHVRIPRKTRQWLLPPFRPPPPNASIHPFTHADPASTPATTLRALMPGAA